MTSPFRGIQRPEIEAFATHLAIAKMLVDQVSTLDERARSMLAFSYTPQEISELQYEARTAWQNAWQHIQAAREIAQLHQCNVGAVDQLMRQESSAHKRGDYFEPARSVNTGGLIWRGAPQTLAVTAIDMLSAAMPEAALAKPTELGRVDIKPSRWWAWAFAAAAGVGGFAIWCAL